MSQQSEQIKNIAIQIRDEQQKNGNSAYKVGDLFLQIGNLLQTLEAGGGGGGGYTPTPEDFYSKTQKYPIDALDNLHSPMRIEDDGSRTNNAATMYDITGNKLFAKDVVGKLWLTGGPKCTQTLLTEYGVNDGVLSTGSVLADPHMFIHTRKYDFDTQAWSPWVTIASTKAQGGGGGGVTPAPTSNAPFSGFDISGVITEELSPSILTDLDHHPDYGVYYYKPRKIFIGKITSNSYSTVYSAMTPETNPMDIKAYVGEYPLYDVLYISSDYSSGTRTKSDVYVGAGREGLFKLGTANPI